MRVTLAISPASPASGNRASIENPTRVGKKWALVCDVGASGVHGCDEAEEGFVPRNSACVEQLLHAG